VGSEPSSARRQLLQALRLRGEARAEELAADLGVTASAVRQHLSGLIGEGLVGHQALRGGPGRPKHVYHLTAAAEHLFPKTYGELASELLEYVEEAEPELLDRLFERRRERRLEQARRRLEGKAFADQVEELARILDEDGYLAAVVPTDTGFRIVEHNCAILSVAQKYGQACSSEIEFIRSALPDATVERVQHMMAGARVCAYEVRPAHSRGTRPRNSGSSSSRARRVR
jgi:DeoR family transcriptional regulator, suf operon transcriptional repressor